MRLEHLVKKIPGSFKLYCFLRCLIPDLEGFFRSLIGLPLVAFHNDVIFQNTIKEIILSFPISSFIETGTYSGGSTGYIARLKRDIPIFGCEINEKFFKQSKKRLKEFKNVKIIKHSSQKFLKDLIKSRSLGSLPLFFLDAHWQNYWPLEDEISIITSSLGRAIIIIDDFEVPDRPEFKFDKYNDKACGLDLIKPKMDKKNLYYSLFPSYSRKQAFPNSRFFSLRGYIIIFQNLKEEFELIADSFSQKYFKVEI